MIFLQASSSRAGVRQFPFLNRLARHPMLRLGLASALPLLAPSAQAAGGHHAVDDASILEPGQCQVEIWQERTEHGAGTLNHVGPGCRWGALEWGLNVDQVRQTGQGRQTFAGPQAKWATALTDQWSVGFSVGANWTTRDVRYSGSTMVIPVTWQPTATLAVHGNLGLDQQPGVGAQARRGLAAEWTPSAHWSFIAERFDDHDARHWRGGVRYLVNERVSLDLSRAAYLGAESRPWWTFGVNWVFSPGAR
ncbi:hypothetical protein OU995_23710 [Roseateles sp. SL47]|uniref:hypothetical protein n=1 Tax=Roseateles sp. SL47 TaxID=2995138 RepID=UPI00227112B5|nr:hypothetical protein [Roseateles sp. SL47]WAC72522.1 hypothetical protein OU995_23710 [Roseateles sp. SL47]